MKYLFTMYGQLWPPSVSRAPLWEQFANHHSRLAAPRPVRTAAPRHDFASQFRKGGTVMLRYFRYAMSALASIGFGLTQN
jgi:hypothetical protein